MAYTMTVCEGKNNAQSFQNPPAEAVDRAIDGLIPAIYHFVILEAEPAIGNCAYIQALIEYEGRAKGRYLVEVRYIFATGIKHYRKHVGDAEEVKRLFRKFTEGDAPNTAGWDDITEKLLAAAG